MKDTIEVSPSFKTALEDIAKQTPVIEKQIPVAEVEPEIDLPIDEPIDETPVNVLQAAKQDVPLEMDDAVAETESDYLIFAIDFLQGLLFNYLAQRKLESAAYAISGDAAMDKLKDVVSKIKQNKILKKEGSNLLTFDSEQMLLKELKQSVDDFCDEIDLDDREKKMIQMPLKELIKIKNKPLSPEMKLVISVLMVSAPRYMGLKAIK